MYAKRSTGTHLYMPDEQVYWILMTYIKFLADVLIKANNRKLSHQNVLNFLNETDWLSLMQISIFSSSSLYEHFLISQQTALTLILFFFQRNGKYTSSADVFAAALTSMLVFTRPPCLYDNILKEAREFNFPKIFENGTYVHIVSFRYQIVWQFKCLKKFVL